MRVNITAKVTDEGVKYLLQFTTTSLFKRPVTLELDRKQVLNLSAYLAQAYYSELDGPVEL